MKKSFFLNMLLTLLLATAGWVLFSSLGVIPRSMSIPLPDSMKTYNSPLYVTGSTVRNELIQIGLEHSVAPGTFSSLGFFDNGDIFQNCYYDIGTDSLYYGLGSQSFQFENRDKEFIRLSEKEFSTMIPAGRCKIALRTDDAPALYHKETFYRWNNWQNGFTKYNKETKTSNFNNRKILEVLVDSETEYITPKTLATLCWLTYSGRIRYWEPETNTAIFCTKDSDGALMLNRYKLHERVQGRSIQEEDYQRIDIDLSGYSCFVVISGSEYLGFSQTDGIVYRVNMTTGDKEAVVQGFHDLYGLNYCYTTVGELVVGAHLSDNEVLWDYTQNQGVCYFKSDYKYIYYMSMNPVGVWIIEADNNSGNNLGYAKGSHEDFRNVEE